MNSDLRQAQQTQQTRERRIMLATIGIIASLCIVIVALTFGAQPFSNQISAALVPQTSSPIFAASPTPSCAPAVLSGIPTPNRNGLAIANAARTQVGVTTIYDANYSVIAYPNGDVPIERGVCTDVVIRALRNIGVDLQVNVHEDMAANFSVYPKDWGLTRTDPNIDHRRVPNLMKYFERKGKALPIASSYIPGDVVAWRLSEAGWMTHIGVVSSELVPCANRYMIVHNIGSGTHEEDALNWWTIIGHYRW